MSAVTIEIAGKPSEQLIRDVFLGPFAGRIAVAHVVGDEAAEAKTLLDSEGWEPELYATIFAGAPITSTVVARAKEPRPLKVWCAVRAPFVIDGEPAVASYLRFGVPSLQGELEKVDRYIPLAELDVRAARLVLTFAAGGAPFLPPARIDGGGPIDRAWDRSVETSRAWLEQAISALRSDRSLTVEVTGLDAVRS
jgi:hypothetical protein